MDDLIRVVKRSVAEVVNLETLLWEETYTNAIER